MLSLRVILFYSKKSDIWYLHLVESSIWLLTNAAENSMSESANLFSKLHNKQQKCLQIITMLNIEDTRMENIQKHIIKTFKL